MDRPLFKRTSLLQRIGKVALRITIMFFVFIFTANALASEMTLQQMQADNRVEISSWLEPNRDIAPGEQLDLYIKVATDHWFGSGTRINTFDIPNTLVMRRKKLANNYTERRNGHTWSIQEWQLTLYPQATGEYWVPAIPVGLTVVDKPGKNITGTLLTKPIKYAVTLPSAQMTSDKQWVSAPKLTLKQTWSVNPLTELKVGDAITRTITMSGEDITAMLFPDMPLTISNELQSYRGEEVAEDTQIRGDFYGSKTWEHTYIVQASGDVVLPKITALWWNTDKSEFTKLSLESASWQVKHTPMSFIKTYGWLLVTFAIACTLLFKLFLVLLSLYQREKLPTSILFFIANSFGKQTRANQYLYRRQFEATDKYQLRDDQQLRTQVLTTPNNNRLEAWFSSQYSVKVKAITWCSNQLVWLRTGRK